MKEGGVSPAGAQCRSIANALRGKGFGNLQYMETKAALELTLLDGLKILLEDKESSSADCGPRDK